MDGTPMFDALPRAETRLLDALARLLQPVEDPSQREIGDLGLRSVVAAMKVGPGDARYGPLLDLAEALAPPSPPAPTRRAARPIRVPKGRAAA